MKIENLAQILIVIALLTGCIAKPQLVSSSIKPVVFIKDNSKSNISMLSLARNKLHVDPHGCIRLGDDSGIPIIWSNGSELEYTSDGKISITNKFNNHKVFIGDEISIGGGIYSTEPTFITPPIPDVCTSHDYWLAAPL